MHQFPKWEEAKSIADKGKKLDKVEEGMSLGINESVRNRFIPYIQLHEFETLLFSDKSVFDKYLVKIKPQGREELNNIFKKFDNPEDINNNVNTSPSARIKKIFVGYDKSIYGNILADEIGLEVIMRKNRRFKEWLNKIENI